MTTKPYEPSARWRTFSPSVQKQHIAAELSRAVSAGLRGMNDLEEEALWRALALIDASLADTQWEGEARDFLVRLRDAVGALYSGSERAAIGRYIMEDLLRE